MNFDEALVYGRVYVDGHGKGDLISYTKDSCYVLLDGTHRPRLFPLSIVHMIESDEDDDE